MAKGFNLTAELNLRGPSNVRQVVSNINKQLKGIKGNVSLVIDPNSAKSIAAINKNLTSLQGNLNRIQSTAKSVSGSISSIGNQFSSMNNAASKASANLNRTAKNISSVGQQAQSAGSQVGKATTLMQDFGKQSALAVKRFAAFSLVTSTVFSLTNAINQAFKQFVEFDRQLVRLQQVTGKTADGLRAISQEISNLSRSLGVSSSELIGVSTTLAQAGLSARETEKALKALALSALAPSFDDLSRTVEGSIALMRQFSISAGDLEKALGSVNAVAASFAVEAGDIIGAIQRTGGVFAAASRGVSEGTDALNEFVAVFTSVRATTRESAETIATGLRTIFTRIQRGSTIEALKEFGITLTDVDGKFVGAYKAIQLLSQGLNQLDPRDIKFSTIVEELGGFRQIGKVIPLIQQFATAQQALAVAQQGQGSLAKDAATAQLSLAVQVAKVREEFLDLIRDVGGTDSFKAITKGALDLASAMISVADSIKGILPVLATLLATKGLRSGFGFAKGFLKEVKGKASGGLITPYAQGGMVDVALMPGETVVSPKVAKRIGLATLNKMNKADKMANGGLAKVPGSGRRDSFYTQLQEGSYVIRTDATKAMGDGTIKDIASGRRKFADGGLNKPIEQGKQTGGVGIFDSDMIGAGSKQLLSALRSSGKSYSVVSGPAGSGKTTFATRRYGKNFVRTPADIERYSQFVVLSGAGATKTGDFSTDAKSLMSGASQVVALQPSSEQVMQQREQRIADAEKSGLPDSRSMKQLQGTMKAPTSIGQSLYKSFGNVKFVKKFNEGGIVEDIIKGGGKLRIGAAILERDKGYPNETLSVKKSQIQAGLPKGYKLSNKFPNQLGGNISLTRKGLSEPTYNAFDQALDTSLVSAVNMAGSKVAQDLGTSFSTINESMAQSFLSGINSGSRGNLFEDVLLGMTGGPFDKRTAGQNFDFPGGLGGVLSDDYEGLPPKWVDAKASFKAAEPAGMARKTVNEILKEVKDKDNLGRYMERKQGVEPEEESQTPKNPLKPGYQYSLIQLRDMLNEPGLTKEEAGRRFRKVGQGYKLRLASGGEVPIMAEEGEYVINKKSARAIGYGNLNRLNKYHDGGVVQQFKTGGSVIPQMAEGGVLKKLGSLFSVLTKPITSLANALPRLTSSSQKASASADKFAQTLQSQVRSSNTQFARSITGGLTPQGTKVLNASQASPAFVNQASQRAVQNGAATPWSPAISAAMRSTPQATRSGRSGGSAPADNIDATIDKMENAGNRFSSLATSVAIGLPLLSTAIAGNKDAQTAATAATQAFANGLATNIGVITLVSSEFKQLTSGMTGFKGRLLKTAGGLATLVAGGLAVAQAFVDAAEASRKFTIENAKNKVEEGAESIKTTLEDISKSGEPLSDRLNDLNKSVRESAIAAKEAATNMGVGTGRSTIIQPLFENDFLGQGLGGTQGANNRSIIAQEKGTIAYLKALTDANAELNYMAELAPKLAKAQSSVFAEAAKGIEDVMIARFKEGESLSDIIDSANWDQNAEVIARQNAAIEKQIVLIESDTRLSEAERTARKNNIISIEAQRVALEKFKQVQTEKALKDLENATNRLSYSFNRILSNMNEAVAAATSTLGQLDSAMQDNIASLQGQARSDSSGGIQKLLDVVANPRAFSKQERSTSFGAATSAFGASGDSIAKVLEIGATLEDTILRTINSVTAAAPEGTTEEKIGTDVGNAVKQQLKNLGLPPELSNKLSAEIGRQVGELRKSGDDNIDFSEIVEKVPAVGRALDSFKSASAAVEGSLKFLQSAFDQLSATTNQLIELQIDSNNKFLRSQDILINGYNTLTEALGKNVSLAEQRYAIENQTRGQTGGTTDPTRIRRNITNLSDRKQNLEEGKAAAQQAQDTGAVLEFERQIKQTSVSLNENVAALQNMAENTELASAALSTLQKAQEKQRAGIGIIEKLVTSTPRQLNELNNSAIRLSRNMAGGLNMGATAEQRGQDLELFNMIAPLLGDQADPLKANVLQSMLQQSGVGITPMFQQLLDTMRNPQADPVQAQAIKTYQDAINKQSDANNELAKINNDLANDISQKTADAIKNAIETVQINFNQKQIDDIISGTNRSDRDVAPPAPAVGAATGGLIYKAVGGNVANTIFKPKGTDTVPAMLTPGEFVVNRASTEKHLPLLRAINKSKGGSVNYYSGGGKVGDYDTNWAKDKEAGEDVQNVSKRPIPYLNTKLLNTDESVSLFTAGGRYVPVFGSDFNYTRYFTDGLKGKSTEEYARALQGKEIKLEEVPTPPIIGWRLGNSPDTTSTMQKAGWLTAGDKYPKFSTSGPSAGNYHSFNPLAGGIPFAGESVVTNATTAESDLFFNKFSSLKYNPDTYSNSKPSLVDDNYSIQGQLKLTNIIKNRMETAKAALDGLQFLEQKDGLYNKGDISLVSGKSIPFFRESSVRPFGIANDNTKSAGIVTLTAGRGAKPTLVNETAKTFGQVPGKKVSFFGQQVEVPGQVGIGNQSIATVSTNNFKSGESIKANIDSLQSNLSDLYNKLESYASDPDFFSSISQASADRTRLAQKIKALVSGSLADVYTTVENQDLNEDWQGKITGGSLALFRESIKQKWNQSVDTLSADQKRELNRLGKYGKDAEIGNKKYYWADLNVAKDLTRRYFRGEQTAAQDANKGKLPEGFTIADKQIVDFDTGKKLSDIGGTLADSPLTGKLNVANFKMPSYTEDNKFTAGKPIEGVMVSNSFATDAISLNPFQSEDLKAKTLYFKDLEEAKAKFATYYAGLVEQYNKDTDTFGAESGLAGLMDFPLIGDTKTRNIDPSIAKVARQKKPLDSNAYLLKTIESLKSKYMDQLGSSVESGSAVVDGLSFEGLQTIQDVASKVLTPMNRVLRYAGVSIPVLSDQANIGPYGEGLLKAGDYLGSLVRNPNGLLAVGYGQLKALGEVFAMLGAGNMSGVLSRLGAGAFKNESDGTPVQITDANSAAQAIMDYGRLITAQGQLAFGGNAAALDQTVDKNLNVRVGNKTQSIAEIFKSGKVELAEVDADTGTYTTSKAGEDQAPKNLRDVGKIVLNPYNVLPPGFRDQLALGLNNILNQSGYQNVVPLVQTASKYLSLQDAFIADTTGQVANPATENAELQKANQAILLLTNGLLGLAPDADRLDAIKRSRTRAQEPQTRANGGLIYASNGTLVNFRPQGTDTVPAMLTPGEFVVNRRSTQKHLPLLKAINNSGAKGISAGDMVQKFAFGGVVQPRYYANGTSGGVSGGAAVARIPKLPDLQISKSSIDTAQQAINSALSSGAARITESLQNLDLSENSISAINQFSSSVSNIINNLAKINIPPQIQFTGNVQVNLTGATGLTQAAESIVNNVIKKAFGDLGLANEGAIVIPQQYK